MKRLKDLDPHLKPREKLLTYGVSNLNDVDLLAIILGSGTKKYDVRRVAIRVLNLFRSTQSITLHNLSQIPGIGKKKAMLLLSAGEFFTQRLNQKEIKLRMTKPQDIVQMFPQLVESKREQLYAVFLDARKRYIAKSRISAGTLDLNYFYPRELFKKAFSLNAHSFILVHNHPSGSPHPSYEDIKVSQKIKNIAKTLGVYFLDHIIIAREGWSSVPLTST